MEEFSAVFEHMNPSVQAALLAVGAMIMLVALAALGISALLGLSYLRYTQQKNSAHITGETAARRLLDANGLHDVDVKITTSLIFGNSYSHYFKTVRLRRLSVGRESLAALAMSGEKVALAVLDRENDPDMRLRNRVSPFITLGPLLFLPLIVLGMVTDYLLAGASGYVTLALWSLALLVYLFSFALSFTTLKTEKKAQRRACSLLSESGMLTEDEKPQLQKLFRLYNIQYINDVVLSLLEFAHLVIQGVAIFSGSGLEMTGNK